jgi:hypothetical protein
MKRYWKMAAMIFLIVTMGAAVIHGKEKKKDVYEIPELCPALKSELFGYIAAAHLTPEEYVISKFEEHDIIFIGEFHRIKQDVKLIQNLIPQLHENGIYHLGIEYALYEDQAIIDSLITSNSYDESAAHTLLFNQFPFWGYQEYADIFKTAWALNRNLPEGSRPFRIVGLNVKADWSHVTCEADREDPAVMKLVWAKGNPEEFMAATIMHEFVANEERALVFSGLHHAFTEYREPRVNHETLEFLGFAQSRMGNIIHDSIGDRAMTIMLHAPWLNAKGYDHPYVYPVDGMVDALLASLPAFYQNVGFDVKGTPFASLPARKTLYAFGYEKFSFGDICDGYICRCALSACSGVTPIENFINDENLDEAKRQSPNPAFKADSITAGIFNEAMREEADIPYRFRKYE